MDRRCGSCFVTSASASAPASGVGEAEDPRSALDSKLTIRFWGKMGCCEFYVALYATGFARGVRGDVDLLIRIRGARYLEVLAAFRIRPREI